MRKPIFVREPTTDEREGLAAGLRSSNAFTVRRCHIVLASARGEPAPRIAVGLGCDDQTVRNAIVAFNQRGLAALQAGSRRPNTVQPNCAGERVEELRGLLHRGPREFGKESRLWTPDLAAEVSFEQGLTPQ